MKLCGEATEVLKCPIWLHALLYLPADKDEEEIQRILDEWDRSGKMDEWLKTPVRLGVD